MTTKELINYVESELKKGEQKDAIKARLLQSGWSGQDVEETFGVAGQNEAVSLENVPIPVQNDSSVMQSEEPKARPKIRWKGGIVLFLILTAISTVISTVLGGSIGGYLEFEGIGEVIVPGAIFALISSLIFTFSVNRTGKKIVKNEYGVKWLVKFNIILVSIIYVTVFLCLFTFGVGFLVADGTAVITFLAFSIPIFVFVFSVLPSLIVYKFYQNQAVFRFVFAFSVVLLLSLIGFRLISEYTCGFYVGPVCLGEKAVKTQNITLCEKIREEDPNDPPFLMRDFCYLAASDSGWNDISMCDRIHNDDLRDECMSQ